MRSYRPFIGRGGGKGSVWASTSASSSAASSPELIIVAPCGFDADAAAARAEGISFPCPAVAVDADSYYSRPAPRLAVGVAQLVHLLHPEHVPDPGLPAIALPCSALDSLALACVRHSGGPEPL